MSQCAGQGNCRAAESHEYVIKTKMRWRAPPKYMLVIERWGTGDPFFGGLADDRALGVSGEIMTRGSSEEPAVFSSIEDAHEAAKHITNRRPGSLLGVSAHWR